MPSWEFQIVIYLAGSSETAAGLRLAYANRYFIPVCGNKDRGWGIRWFSRGKFSVGHSDSPSGAFLVCLSFFSLLPLSTAGAAIETGYADVLSFDLGFSRWFLRLRATVNLTADGVCRFVDLETDLFVSEFLRERIYNFVNYFIRRIYFLVWHLDTTVWKYDIR